jgi:2-alkenal reductase
MNKKAAIILVGLLILSTLACSFTPDLFSSSGKEMNQITVIPPTQVVAALPGTPTSSGELSSSVEYLDLLEKEALIVSLYDRVSKGVVSIQTLTAEGGGLGSGFVYDSSGHIVTNFHVVENATDLEVDFPSGFKTRGKVIATDLDSDLAVIKVDVPEDILFPIQLGNSDVLKVGQTVIAIGNPFGLSGTITVGIVSAKGRTLSSFRQASNGGFFSAGDIIQTDAAINPGNSGGPLLNLNGEVIGVNRAIRTDTSSVTGDPINSGIGFAISSNIINRVVPFLIEKGFYDYPYVGVTSQEDLTLIEREELNIEQNTGAYVLGVSANSPAEKAGLIGGSQPTNIAGLFSGGDLIVSVDGRTVRVFGEFLSYLMANKSPGDEITMGIIRDGVYEEVMLKLGKRP